MATSKPANAPATANDSLDPVFQIQRVYLKEISLEQPNSPSIFLETEQPTLDIQLSIETLPVLEGVYEVSVTATVQTSVKEKTVFLIEAKQAAIFEIRNLPADQLGPILGIACPQIIYPYLRSNVADVVTRAGFPPIHLAEINFEAFYQQRMQAIADAAAPAANT